MLDEHWIKALHVETMREADLHQERESHVLFQASTIGALLEGAYDGDLTCAELVERGDLGLGTFNGLNGEMIVLDGHIHRADVDGLIHNVSGAEKTPFAVVARFEPTVDCRLGPVADGAPEERRRGPLGARPGHGGRLTHEWLLRRLDELIPDGAASCAVRLDGRFELVRARSVPRQQPPYRPLTEVVAEQHVFELADIVGTMVGFRFPDYVEGIEVSGYHLHFLSEDGKRGGHVLDSLLGAGGLRARLDPSSELHIELPPDVDLADPDLAAATHDAVEQVERLGDR